MRIEFQDGKRKRRQGWWQLYHGRGSPHIHALLWLRNVQQSTLLQAVSATEVGLFSDNDITGCRFTGIAQREWMEHP